MQNRTGLDKWTHLYMRLVVDITRFVLRIPADDPSDDDEPWFRYDNHDGWVFDNKDWGYIIGHIIGWCLPVVIVIILI